MLLEQQVSSVAAASAAVAALAGRQACVREKRGASAVARLTQGTQFHAIRPMRIAIKHWILSKKLTP